MRTAIDMLTTFSLAAGLSVDSLAAAMATGLVLRRPRWCDAAMVGTTFGACQMAIALAGTLVGVALMRVVGDWDHWIAFALLMAIGAQMIRQALGGESSAPMKPSWFALLAMGVGTSIDAGVVGIGLGLTEFDVPPTVVAIGAVTFAFSFAGVMCGRCVGRRAGVCAQVLGGLVLAAIGARILVVHLGL